MPEFVGVNSLLQRKYVQPILSSPELSFIKFDPATPEHRPLLELLCSSYRLYEEKPEGYELELQQRMLEFWKDLHALIRAAHGSGRAAALAAKYAQDMYGAVAPEGANK